MGIPPARFLMSSHKYIGNTAAWRADQLCPICARIRVDLPRGSRYRPGSPLPRSPVELYDVLRTCWSNATGGKWLPSNPAQGQCSVTALVVQDVLGGDIL